jgi:hypothetical protein
VRVNKELSDILRLIRVICLWFIIAFVLFTMVNFLALKIHAVRSLWLLQSNMELFASAVWSSLPPVIYLVILIGLSYSARRGIGILLSFICVCVISLVWLTLFTLMFSTAYKVVDLLSNNTPLYLGESGLIMEHEDNVIVLVGGLTDPDRGQVVAKTGEPLRYESENDAISSASLRNETESAPLIFFRHDSVQLLGNIQFYFERVSQQLNTRLNESLLSFYVYTASIIFCLCCLRFVFNLSTWPLANIFLGAILFRGVLGVGNLFEQDIVRSLFLRFWVDGVPVSILEPALFCVLGLLFTLAAGIAFLIKKRWKVDEDY